MDNGYLDTYYILNGMDRAFTNLKDHHELYCLGHLVEGAVAYYQGTGKDKLLKAACRFADYVDSVFGRDEGKLHGYPGHEIAEMALVRLYETTGERRYLDLARYFVTERGRSPLYFEAEDRRRAELDGTAVEPNTNCPSRTPTIRRTSRSSSRLRPSGMRCVPPTSTRAWPTWPA